MNILSVGAKQVNSSAIVNKNFIESNNNDISSVSCINDEFNESDDTKKFKNIVKKYDITNISRNELNALYKELFDNKLISLKDMFVTFDPTRIQKGHNEQITVSGWKMEADSNKKIDFLEGMQIQMDWNKKFGDAKFQDVYNKRFELAEKIKFFQGK